MNVRPFRNADARGVAGLVTAGVRGGWVYLPEHFRESPDPRRRRLVAERGGEVIATAHLLPFGDSAPDALRLDLAAEGAAFTPLYLALLSDVPPGFSRLLGVCREDFNEQMAFFAAAGFRNAWQSWGARLKLETFDFARFRPLEEKLFLAGYEVERWPAHPSQADWSALHALCVFGERDAPRNPTTSPEPLTLEALRRSAGGEGAAFVIRWRGEVVALARLTVTPTGAGGTAAAEVELAGTVTHPAHRSRGLATLLGGRALAWAQAEGHRQAGTGGAVLNLPLLRVCTRLGYVPEPMWVTWERAAFG